MAFETIRAAEPRYRQIPVSSDLTLHFDLDDTWIAIKDNGHADDCTCVMVGIDEIDSLILQLQQAREMIKNEK
jgi:hypothetical protein